MPLTAKERGDIATIWAKVAGHTDELGAEVLDRLFKSSPATKTYFSKFNLDPGSADMKRQGGKILNAIGAASQHLDNLASALSQLSDLHAFILRVDPGNFPLLCHNILVVLAVHFPKDFTPSAHSAWDKFLCSVSVTLCSKYR
ncbi:hemoglobin subunit alpha-B-like [Hyla sarda]|uniref:hemoglobin subunit alpha-B-like n=1 Tax=Hyla sarda TaxID=327740 RepID=UPI0024C34431|nr:hemoglobin subunit alpha-B-like [Hyla sarda]